MKKIAILYTEYTSTIDAIKYQLSEYEIDVLTNIEDEKKYDLVILCNYNDVYSGNALKCHYSLLPAFDCEEPEKAAILENVKVTGITILFTNPKKIIAQYPVFITNSMHYDDLKMQLNYLEQAIFPIIIEKVLNNEQFEISSLFKASCSGNCGGCSTCSH